MNDKFKKILTVIGIPIIGFIILNLAFIFTALIHFVFNRLFRMDYNMTRWVIPVSRHIMSALIIILISWFVFKSKKIKELYKAIYAVVPTAVVLVIVGMFLNPWPFATYTIDALIYGAIIYYLYIKKKPWFYYYSVTWVTLALLVMGILGIDI